MPRKDKGPAPVGDAMHSPKARSAPVPNPTGNRAERRAAEKQSKKKN